MTSPVTFQLYIDTPPGQDPSNKTGQTVTFFSLNNRGQVCHTMTPHSLEGIHLKVDQFARDHLTHGIIRNNPQQPTLFQLAPSNFASSKDPCPVVHTQNPPLFPKNKVTEEELENFLRFNHVTQVFIEENSTTELIAHCSNVIENPEKYNLTTVEANAVAQRALALEYFGNCPDQTQPEPNQRPGRRFNCTIL